VLAGRGGHGLGGDLTRSAFEGAVIAA
jgi:hypothetical protein